MKSVLLRIFLGLVLFQLWQPAPVQAQSAAYISPLPGSNYNPAGTTIAVRYGDPLDRQSVDARLFYVQGSLSGSHAGTALLALDNKTIIFKPYQPFMPSETVYVTLSPGITSNLGKIYSEVSFSFNISKKTDSAIATPLQIQNALGIPALKAPASTPKISSSSSLYLTTPYDFPVININVPANQTGDGDIFVTQFKLAGQNSGSYLLTLDNSGQPVYYQKLPGNSFALDFKELPNGNLAYWDTTTLSYTILNNHYAVVDMVSAQNGYSVVDLHELQLLPDGDYLFMIYDTQPVDMSQLVPGGNPNASVTGLVIQELDPQKNVVFQWKSWDHIPITDSNQDLTAAVIDYVHGNALELDTDGNILLSSRHLDEITKINHTTGAILWRMGGKSNQFSFSSIPAITDDPHFYFQHDIRRQSSGHITLFDNHNLQQPQASRALEFVLDEQAKTAQLVWEYRNTPDSFAPFMGNVQRLPNGNTVIGWGGNPGPNITEVKPDGSKAFELSFDGTYINYRAFRFVWHGYPTWNPTLVQTANGNTLKLTFSWNGATEISSYRILAGNSPQPDQVLAVQPKTGFETSFQLNSAQSAYCYFRVIPINNNNALTQYSNVVFNPNCGTKTFLPNVSQAP